MRPEYPDSLILVAPFFAFYYPVRPKLITFREEIAKTEHLPNNYGANHLFEAQMVGQLNKGSAPRDRNETKRESITHLLHSKLMTFTFLITSLSLIIFPPQLKEKFKEIERSMYERETEIMSENLRVEYTRQLENIRRLKTLYEQRARSADAEIEILKRKLTDKTSEVDNEILKYVVQVQRSWAS